MKNKKGTTEDMIEYHENGNKSYEFTTDSDTGVITEFTYDKNGYNLSYKDSNGYTYFKTREDNGMELAFKNSEDYYEIKSKEVTQQEYEAFIQSLEQPKQQTVVQENTIYFTLKNEVEPIMKISNGNFYWKEEEIDDIHNVYEKLRRLSVIMAVSKGKTLDDAERIYKNLKVVFKDNKKAPSIKERG